MFDQHHRKITYLRISVTDRCNLRCTYCMPAHGVPSICHEEILSYEEIVRLAKLFVGLGIKKIRLTGGEPLVRPHVSKLVAQLKAIPGLETVVLTTNGLLLAEQLDELLAAGLDGVNISLDAIDDSTFHSITRRYGVNKVLESIDKALSYPHLQVKVNCVPTQQNETQLLPMVEHLLKQKSLSLRFIELMPIGEGRHHQGKSEYQLRQLLENAYGSLVPMVRQEETGNCRCYQLPNFQGNVGFISAMSHQFCQSCNRIRLTTDGFLKTCLQYNHGVELKPLLQQSDAVLVTTIAKAIKEKPLCHHFHDTLDEHWETRIMSKIGG